MLSTHQTHAGHWFRGTQVQTARSLRRLGRDIPRGTIGFITEDMRPDRASEVRIRTEFGAFVVAPGEFVRA